MVRAELGQPLSSIGRVDCDVFAFEEGSSGWKYVRAMGYSLLDIGTLGLSEVATNPVEASVGKDKIQLRVCYTASQVVAYSERLQVGKPAQLMTGAYPPQGAEPIVSTPNPPAAPADVSPAVTAASDSGPSEPGAAPAQSPPK